MKAYIYWIRNNFPFLCYVLASLSLVSGSSSSFFPDLLLYERLEIIKHKFGKEMKRKGVHVVEHNSNLNKGLAIIWKEK